MKFVDQDLGATDGVAPNGSLARQVGRKWPISYRAVEAVAILTDIVIIFLTSVLSGLAYHLQTMGTLGAPTQYVAFAAVVAALFVPSMRSGGLYQPMKLLALRSQLKRIALIWTSVFLFLAGVLFALKIGTDFSRGATLSFAAIGFVALGIQRAFWRSILTNGLTRSKFSGRKVVLITDTDESHDAALSGVLTNHGFQLDRQFRILPSTGDVNSHEEVIARAVAHLRGSDIQEIMVAADLSNWPKVKAILSRFRIIPLPISVIAQGSMAEILKRPLYPIGNIISVEWQRSPLSAIERALKRVVDILCAGTGLIVLLPLLMVTAIAVKLESPGPVLFRQRRCGFNGKIFHIYKFRTMSVMEDGNSVIAAARSDNRITRLGKWLRRTSIDELPQLLNVLSGAMSIVGPRPHALAHDNEFDQIVRNYAFRHHVKPGLTGWAQVNGYRGSIPNLAHLERRVELDIWYIDNWTVGLDIAIMFRTVLAISRGDNAY
jgi:Undecaprenyl-phosphate glucose phosphotransferase